VDFQSKNTHLKDITLTLRHASFKLQILYILNLGNVRLSVMINGWTEHLVCICITKLFVMFSMLKYMHRYIFDYYFKLYREIFWWPWTFSTQSKSTACHILQDLSA